MSRKRYRVYYWSKEKQRYVRSYSCHFQDSAERVAAAFSNNFGMAYVCLEGLGTVAQYVDGEPFGQPPPSSGNIKEQS